MSNCDCVAPNLLTVFLISSSIIEPVIGSRPEVGSSNNNILVYRKLLLQ